MKSKALAVLNLITFIAHVSITYLGQDREFSRFNHGDISAQYETVIAPAGITFSIWGLIYISLAAFCIYHLIVAFTKPEEHHSNKDLKEIGWLFAINNIATACWTLAWVNQQVGIAAALILIQLLTLIWISMRAHISNPDRPLSTKISTQFPLSIYFGWITIATVANISSWLVSLNWDGGPITPINWTIILIGFITLLTVFIVVVRRNIYFGLVVLWALYGIIIKRNEVDPVQYEAVIMAAWAAIVMIVIALAIRLFRKYQPYSTDLVT